MLNISGEFKIMHFTSSNLLHNFSNGKYMLFSLKKKKIYVKNVGQPDPVWPNLQPNLPEPIFNPLKMIGFWPVTRLTCNLIDPPKPDPTRPFCHVYAHILVCQMSQ